MSKLKEEGKLELTDPSEAMSKSYLKKADDCLSARAKDLSLREESKQRLAAYIGDRTVEIDFKQNTIIHRCPTWAKSIREKKFCPHLVKLFLSIEPEKANNILSNINSKLGDWKFESRLVVEFPK